MTEGTHTMNRLLACLIVALGALWFGNARAVEADLYCLTGTSSTGAPIFKPASSTEPCPVSIVSTPSAPIYFTPVPVTLTHTGGTVTLGNTFQTVLAANASRKNCLLQNTSTHTGYVFFGTLGSATTSNSVQVAPNGGAIACGAVNGPVSQQTVNFTTSTTSDTWVVTEGQ